MVVINMWFIKHSNGLMHYGLDYAEALDDDVREIWVRHPDLAKIVQRRMPSTRVVVIKAGKLLSALLKVRQRGDLVFTPTSHPLPFISRQVVIVHDSYPFGGRRGRIKQMLFRIGLGISGATAGYINYADARAFLVKCGLSDAKMQYLPNRLGTPSLVRTKTENRSARLVIGLFGSDSPKKNYDALFAVAGTLPGNDFVWRIFGHANDYTVRLLVENPALTIEVVESDSTSMERFIDTIDLAVSAAEGEGFARPIAMALMRGVPTLLLDTPVFREFYAGSAPLFDTPRDLVAAISKACADTTRKPFRFAREHEMRTAFAEAVVWLRSRAG